MNKIITAVIVAFIAFTSGTSCRKMSTRLGDTTNTGGGGGGGGGTNPTGLTTDLTIPAGFNFNLVEPKSLTLTINDNNDQALPQITVWIMTNTPSNNGEVLFKGNTNAQGKVSFTIDLPTYYTQVLLNTTYKGIPRNIILPVTNTINTFTIGGSSPNTFNTISENQNFSVSGKNLGKNQQKFSAKIGNWNNVSGVPSYIVPTQVSAAASVWYALNQSFPERVDMVNTQPQWLDDAQTNRFIMINSPCDIYTTFVSETSGNKNVLFYYVYNTGNPPATLNDIDSLYIVYPNTSFNNSGGGLVAGNTVKIGTFGPGQTVAFGIAVNGFAGGTSGLNGVTTGTALYFATKELNPESDPNKKQHAVMLRDASTLGYFLGFEDESRESSSCDNDFNDNLFYVFTNPVASADFANIPDLAQATDMDGDLVFDAEDDYPLDPSKAFNNFYPAIGKKGTIVFEENWPVKGDFDMNDLVVDYQYQLVTNANNQVNSVTGFYTLRASGGENQSSFAVEIPALRSNITNFSGAVLEGSTVNGVIRLFPDKRSAMASWNTKPGEPTVDSVNYQFNLSLVNPVSIASFGLGIYNPFVWNNNNGQDRGFETHLPGKVYTNAVNVALLGTADDNTQVGGPNYYVTKNNLFWGLAFPSRFDYLIEGADLNKAYLKFGGWAQTAGMSNKDWYLNKPGSRDNSKIYVKP